MSGIKKESILQSINHKILEQYNFPYSVQIIKIEEVEIGEMWSFIGKKKKLLEPFGSCHHYTDG